MSLIISFECIFGISEKGSQIYKESIVKWSLKHS